MTKAVYHLVLETPDDGQAHLRLRAALKCLGRSYRLRCLDVQESTEPNAADTLVCIGSHVSVERTNHV